jgi:hypothetical protein
MNMESMYDIKREKTLLPLSSIKPEKQNNKPWGISEQSI